MRPAESARSAHGRPDVVQLARELIRVPSPNPGGSELAVADVLEDVIGSLDLPRPTRIQRDCTRPNLITTLDFGSGGRHIALAGHLDTKPVGDADWKGDPFGAEVDGDRLYGLGSTDMKAAIAAMVVAAAGITSSGLSSGRLSLLFTADEENGSAFGARHVMETAGLSFDGVVIGEPGGIEADFDRLHLVSRGIARLRLACSGPQGHSSLIDEMHWANPGIEIARSVVAIADQLHLPTPPNTDGLGGWQVTVNPGLVYRGGVGYGVLPGRMVAEAEVRLLPGMDRETVAGSFAEVLSNANLNGTVEFDEPPTGWLPASRTSAKDPLAQVSAAAAKRVFGSVPLLSVFPGTTDASWFGAVGGIPTLPALGPGLLRRAHGADEWVSVDALRSSVELYRDIVEHYCAGEPPVDRNERDLDLQ